MDSNENPDKLSVCEIRNHIYISLDITSEYEKAVHNCLDQLSDSFFNLRSSQVVHSKKIIGLTRSRKLVDASMVNLETVLSKSTRDGLYENKTENH